MSYRTLVTLIWSTICGLYLNYGDVAWCMSLEEKDQLKEQAREMFYHAYKSYMDHAYPADELMPLSCKGRYRDIEPNRGDVDDALGNFSLTLVDTLDTLVVLGDFDEFEHAVKRVIKDVSFDNDVVVSVFETNIRMLGGLLSGHILGSYLQENLNRMHWYRGELLNMARDLGFRLVPAFNTTTGVPHPRINLRYGLKSPKLGVVRETCTACAGTMILEFAALSRLTGETVFEEKARTAMDYLWQQRHRTSDLMGTVLNIHNGDWIRRDSGVGAGIDSYYEYCLKAYILLGDDVYLERFNKHYSAVMKYVSQGPLLVDVHMHRPHTNSRNFMDSLLAFWPGLQVLKGDIKPAIETHEMLYQVMQRHNFLPEAFTVDFQVHWGQHPLRPEFVESTYFLYKATNDPYYLEVGKKVLNSLQTHARVACGFAAVKDVRTGSHEDRMDSFVLAETLKYLYLLFANKDELTLEVDDFVFTTEAHLLPLSLARISNSSIGDLPKLSVLEESIEEDFTHSCPNTHYLFPEGRNFAQSIRLPLKNLVEGVCPSSKSRMRTLHASEFQTNSRENLETVKRMGITVLRLSDGRIQLIHNATMAESPERAEEGIIFMQEMIELAKNQKYSDHSRTVYFYLPQSTTRVLLDAGPAQFGIDIKGKDPFESEIRIAQPKKACSDLKNGAELVGKIAVVERGECMFIEKARYLQKVGAIAGIVLDNHPGTSAKTSPMFAMSGDGKDDVTIPMVFLFNEEAALLLSAHRQYPDIMIGIAEVSAIPDAAPSESNAQSSPSSKIPETQPGSGSAEVTDSKPGPQSYPKFFDEDEFIIAQKRVQFLLSKLHNLQQIKVDLDQLLALTREFGDESRSSSKDGSDAYQKVTREADFKIAVERLMRKEKILEIDQDVQVLLSRLRQLVQFQPSSAASSTKESLPIQILHCEYSTLNPLHSKTAFVHFVSDKIGAPSYSRKFSCKDCILETSGNKKRILKGRVFGRTEKPSSDSHPLPEGDL
ncbi:ER degradation-enhancing alpha-mannosidase-like protein 3 [Uloborus diversus]|uniref:ER degradation-enhancing alpha-mannosidase-like protein 3 n=1 Tax=Uloborus diversus TaxID=327109 RepID=UPI0024097368|nr:ER degradation-enhancing alpha-mannosidase-like protein 3 [Uloborus diversus]